MGMRTESQIISFIDIWVNTQSGTQEKAGLETVAMILLKLQDPNLLPIAYTAEPYRMCARACSPLTMWIGSTEWPRLYCTCSTGRAVTWLEKGLLQERGHAYSVTWLSAGPSCDDPVMKSERDRKCWSEFFRWVEVSKNMKGGT